MALVLLSSGCVTNTKMSKSNAVESTQQKGPNLEKAARARLSLGIQYLKLGQVERAKHNFDKAMEHDSDLAAVQIGMGWYYENVQEPEKARKYYKRAIQLQPNNGDNLNTYASFLCTQDDYSAADKYYRKAISQKGYANLAATLENAGLCAQQSGALKLAEDYFSKALNHNPALPKTLLALAQIRFKQQQYLNSRAYLERYSAAGKPTAQSLWLGIQIERILGNKNALSSYQLQLVRLFPKSKEAKLYLSSVSK